MSRVCGDDPQLTKFYPSLFKICPAYAGMIPLEKKVMKQKKHLSRVCGDDPKLQECSGQAIQFVPRMRG